MLHLAHLSVRAARALVHIGLAALVEQRPDEVDADADDDQRVQGHGVRVELDPAPHASDGSNEATRIRSVTRIITQAGAARLTLR